MLSMYVYPKSQSNQQYIHDSFKEQEKEPKTLTIHQPKTIMRYIQKGIDKSRTQNTVPKAYTTMPLKIRLRREE